jgi:hypothetical protein
MPASIPVAKASSPTRVLLAKSQDPNSRFALAGVSLRARKCARASGELSSRSSTSGS